MDHCLVTAKAGFVQLNEAMSHAMQSQPRQTDHSGEFPHRTVQKRVLMTQITMMV